MAQVYGLLVQPGKQSRHNLLFEGDHGGESAESNTSTRHFLKLNPYIMKAFNLEKALAGEPVVTRNGRKVQEIHHFKMDKSEWCVGVVIDGGFYSYCIDGTQMRPFEEDAMDLFMYTVKKTVWVNIFEGSEAYGMSVGSYLYETEQEAMCQGQKSHRKLICTYRMEIEL